MGLIAGPPGAYQGKLAMTVTRRHAVRSFAKFLLVSPLLKDIDLLAAERDELPGMVNVFDFKKLAQQKLDSVAWDYMDEGGKDEVSLSENRSAFDRIIIRPRFLTEVHKIDISTTFLGHELTHPIFIDPAGRQKLLLPQGRGRGRQSRRGNRHDDVYQRRHR